MYDTSELSCSNGGNASLNIAHTPGSVPDGTAYDTHVREVDSSDEGEFEYVITDLTPGNVSILLSSFHLSFFLSWRQVIKKAVLFGMYLSIDPAGKFVRFLLQDQQYEVPENHGECLKIAYNSVVHSQPYTTKPIV